MRVTIAKKLIAAIGISAITVCGAAVTASADPPRDKKPEKHAQAKPAHAQPRTPQPHAQPPAEQARRQPSKRQAPPDPQPQQQARHDQARPKAPQPQQHAAAPADRAQPARASRPQPQEFPGRAPQRQDVRAVPRPVSPPPARVSADAPAPSTVRRVRLAPQAQHAVITQQQRRITQYSADLSQARRVAEQQSDELQRQHRTAQYRFMQAYVSRLQQQEVALRNYRYYDYDSDPYFYTPADYRYYRGGQYYETNEYGIALLRQALNNGYREGWMAGTADREDGWRPSYGSSYAYRDANYGYNGYYLDRSTYNHYFREGFRRGYDDGYGSRYRYGRNSNGTRSLLGSVLNALLRIEHLG